MAYRPRLLERTGRGLYVLLLMTGDAPCASVVRRGVEEASSSLLFFYAKDGFAYVFNFAARRDAFEHQDVVARAALRGRKREDKARAWFCGLRFEVPTI